MPRRKDEDSFDWDEPTNPSKSLEDEKLDKIEDDWNESMWDADTGSFALKDAKKFWNEVSQEVSSALMSIPERIPKQDMARERLDNIDMARGFAIALMMLSHTVMALNTYQMLPEVAFMPVHLITKFSSTLFILIFGISIAKFYLPYYHTDKWSAKRNRLLWRGFTILLWYKILTLVQMFQTRTREDIIDTLLFNNFTDFAEVLNFYWLIIILIAIFIPIWIRMNWILRIITIIVVAVSGVLLEKYFDFWGYWQIKAMLVEYPRTYCYGQFQRGAVVLFAMFLGGIFLERAGFNKDKFVLGAVSIGLAVVFGTVFLILAGQSELQTYDILLKISKNWGKHPPNALFMSFSLFGAFSIFGLCLIVPSWLTFLFKPISLIGKEPFFCFNWHLILIFVVFRYIMNLRWDVTYTETILLFAVAFMTSFLLSPINTLIKKRGVLWKWLLP